MAAMPGPLVAGVAAGTVLDAVPEAMARERGPLYAATAHQVLDRQVLSPAQATRSVVQAV